MAETRRLSNESSDQFPESFGARSEPLSENSETKVESELSPEAIEKIVDEHLIDVEAYEGIMQYTQVANISSILSEGIKVKGTRRWGTSGRIVKHYNSGSGIYLTHKNRKDSFKNWMDGLPWSNAGPIAILFRPKTIDKLDIIECIQDPDGSYPSEKFTDKDKKILTERDGEITLNADNRSIDKQDIEAFVLSPVDSTLERRAHDYLKAKGSLIKITADQLRVIAINRLDRLSKSKGEKNLVPIYNSDGDMIWPKQISHEEVRRLIIERDAEKETK